MESIRIEGVQQAGAAPVAPFHLALTNPKGDLVNWPARGTVTEAVADWEWLVPALNRLHLETPDGKKHDPWGVPRTGDVHTIQAMLRQVAVDIRQLPPPATGPASPRHLLALEVEDILQRFAALTAVLGS